MLLVWGFWEKGGGGFGSAPTINNEESISYYY